jgi:phage gp29-like protein
MTTGLWVSPTKYIDFAGPSRSSLTQEVASRSLAWDYSSMIGLLPDPDPILRKRGDGVEVLEELTSDGKVLTAIQTRKLGSLKREYEFNPGTVDGQDDTRAEQLCKDLTADLEGVGMYDLLSGLLDAPYYGMTPAELFWEPRDGSIHLANVRVLPSRWFGFDQENNPRFRSLANQTEGDEIPWGKMVFARHFPTYDNPFGLRLLSRCLWPVAFKKGGTKFWVTFAEKYGMPFLVGKYRQGATPDEQQTLLGALAKMVQDAVAVIPDGNVIEFLDQGGSSGSSSTDTFDRLRAAMDAEISQVLMGQTLTAEVGENGSYAASKTHEDVLEDYREADQRLVKGVMDEIGKIYRDINAPEVPAPVFSWFESEDPQADFANRDKTLTESGLKIKKSYYVRRYGFLENEVEVGEAVMENSSTGAAQPQQDAKQEFAERSTGGAIEEALLAWAREQSAQPAASMVDAADALLGQVETLEQFRDRLIELFAGDEPERLGEIMARMDLLGNLSGRYSTELESDKQ